MFIKSSHKDNVVNEIHTFLNSKIGSFYSMIVFLDPLIQ